MFEMNEALPESMADVSHKQTQTHTIIIMVITVWLDSQANCSVFFLYELCNRNEPKR